MELVRQKALQLGRDSAFGAGEVARAFVELAKSGQSAEQIVGGVGDAVVRLAAAADIKLNDAAITTVNILQTFHLAASDAVKVVDLLAGAANASTIEVEDLAFATKYAGSVAAATGISVGDLITSFALLGQAGIRGSTGGTSMRRILLNLVPVSDKAKDVMKELGIITADGGNKFFTAAGKAKSMAEIAQVLQDSTRGLSDAQKVQALNTIFGNRAVASAIILANGGAEAFNKMKTEIGKVTAEDVMNQRLDNLSGQLKILKSSLETAFIQAGTPLQNVLKGWVEQLTKLVNAFAALSPETQKTIIQVALVTAAFLLFTGVMFKVTQAVLRAILLFRQLAQGIKILQEMALFSRFLGPIKAFGAAIAGLIGGTGAIIAALVLLDAALVFVWVKFKNLRDIITGAVAWLAGPLSLIVAAAGLIINHWREVSSFFTGLPGKIGGALTAVGKFFTDIFGGAIDWVADRVRGFVNGFKAFVAALSGEGITAAGNKIVGVFERIGVALRNFVLFVVSLPSKIPGALAAVATAFGSFLEALPGRLGFAIGFLIGRWLRLWIDMTTQTVQGGVQVITALVGWLTQLPGLVWNFLVQAITAWINFQIQLVQLAVQTGLQVLEAIANFFVQLPGRVWSALVATITAFVNFHIRMLQLANALGQQVLSTIVSFLSQLPGRVVGFFGEVVNAIRDAVPAAVDWALRMGETATNALINGIKGLPGEVSKILDFVIDSFLKVIQKGFNAAKNFAGGLVEGFLSGLFGSPHTVIEYAVWDMLSSVTRSVDDLQTQLGRVHSITLGVRGVDASLSMAQGVITPRSTPATSAALATRQASELAELTKALAAATGDVYLDKERVGKVMAPSITKATVNRRKARS